MSPDDATPRAYDARDGRFGTLLDDDGNPPHGADACGVCALFAGRRPDESRRAWLARLAGETEGRP